MQPLKETSRFLFHLSLLAGALAVMVASTHPKAGPERVAAQHAHATTESAFRVHSRTHPPPFGQARVRRVVEATFVGVPQHGTTLGDPKAPVTMQFLADPKARQFAVRGPRGVRRLLYAGQQ